MTWEAELTAEGSLPLDMEFVTSGAKAKNIVPNALPPWTFVTYDLVKNEDVANAIAASPFRTVIADECHLIKHSTSQRSKQLIGVTRHIPVRFGLTGSPITNEILDIFGQMNFIDLGRTFGDNQWKFLKKYYLKANVGGGASGWFPRKNAKDQIAQKLGQVAFHVHEDDVLKLPPVTSITKGARMSGQQRRYSEDVIEHFELNVNNDDEPIEFNYIVQQVTKLRQIASGFFYYDVPGSAKRKTRRLTCPKLDLLTSLIAEGELSSKRKIVVWANYSAELRRIVDELNRRAISAIRYSGSMSAKERKEARLAFASPKGPRVFVGQADMGVGMNELACSDTAVYFSNSYRVASRQQSEARIRRKGSEGHKVITYYDLVTEGSIDLSVLQSLKTNIHVANFVMNQLRDGNPLRKILASRI